MRHTFKKEERLSSEKAIQRLFETGNSFRQFPFYFIWKQENYKGNYPVKIAISVPKKRIKKAVVRNRIKRLIREAYRQHKHRLYPSLEKTFIMMIVYTASEELPYSLIESKIKQGMKRFLKEIRS